MAALTNAERQARYRERQTAFQRNGQYRKRLSAYISLGSLIRLRNLAAYHEVSQGKVIDIALEVLEKALVDSIEDLSMRGAYHDGRLRKDGTVANSEATGVSGGTSLTACSKTTNS